MRFALPCSNVCHGGRARLGVRRATGRSGRAAAGDARRCSSAHGWPSTIRIRSIWRPSLAICAVEAAARNAGRPTPPVCVHARSVDAADRDARAGELVAHWKNRLEAERVPLAVQGIAEKAPVAEAQRCCRRRLLRGTHTLPLRSAHLLRFFRIQIAARVDQRGGRGPGPPRPSALPAPHPTAATSGRRPHHAASCSMLCTLQIPRSTASRPSCRRSAREHLQRSLQGPPRSITAAISIAYSISVPIAAAKCVLPAPGVACDNNASASATGAFSAIPCTASGTRSASSRFFQWATNSPARASRSAASTNHALNASRWRWSTSIASRCFNCAKLPNSAARLIVSGSCSASRARRTSSSVACSSTSASPCSSTPNAESSPASVAYVRSRAVQNA